MSAEADRSNDADVGQAETDDDVYVGDHVFQQVLSAVRQEDAEAAFAFDYDEQGELSQYGVGVGGKRGRGVYMTRKEDEDGQIRFNVYQIGKHDDPAVQMAPRLRNADTDWTYAVRQMEQTFDRDLLTGGTAMPAENRLSEEILPLFQRVAMAFTEDAGTVYTLTDGEGERLADLEPYDE
jgi:hypothetical protein